MTYTEKADAIYTETAQALRDIYNELNHGQQQKLLKNEKIKELLERYGVVPNDEKIS